MNQYAILFGNMWPTTQEPERAPAKCTFDLTPVDGSPLRTAQRRDDFRRNCQHLLQFIKRDNEGYTQYGLAALLGKSPMWLRPSLQALFRAGYIRSVKLEDNRVVWYLPEKGRNYHE